MIRLFLSRASLLLLLSLIARGAPASCAGPRATGSPHATRQQCSSQVSRASARSVTTTGLLHLAGLGDPRSVRAVIYHRSGWPGNAEETLTGGSMVLAPFRLGPVHTSDARTIRALYEAVDNAHRVRASAGAPVDRLAFVARSGKVVVFAVGAAASGSGVWVGCCHLSTKLAPLLLAMARMHHTSHFSRLHISRAACSDGQRMVSHTPQATARWRHVVSLARALLGRYCPLTLKGNVRSGPQDASALYFAEGVPRTLEVKLAKPAVVEAVVLPEALNRLRQPSQPSAGGWPPEVYDAAGRAEPVRFDTVSVYEETRGTVRLVLIDSATHKGILTDAIPVGGQFRQLRQAMGCP